MMFIGGLGSLYGYLSKNSTYRFGWQIGYVNFSIVIIVVLSAFVTGFFSMKNRGKLSPHLVKKLLGIILLVISRLYVTYPFHKIKMAEENALCHFGYFSSFFTSSHRISISIKERSLSDTPRSKAFPSTLRKTLFKFIIRLT